MRYVSRTRSAKYLSLLLFISYIALPASPVQAQSLGRSKVSLVLRYKRPPQLYLAGPSFAVVTSSRQAVSQTVLRQLKEYLEGALAQADPRITPVSDNPDTIIACSISELSASSKPETRYRSEYRQTGTNLVYNSNTQTYESAPVYAQVTEPYRVISTEGWLVVDYRCLDAVNESLIGSDTVTARYRSDHPSDAPDPQTIYYDLVRDVAYQIEARFRQSYGETSVALPRGKLKSVSEQLRKGFWHSALAGLTTMPPLRTPEDEACRLYSIGLANEGIAYEAPDILTTAHYLGQALNYHTRAHQLDPAESAFYLAKIRSQQLGESFGRHQRITSAFEARTSSDPPANSSPVVVSPPGFATNTTVIDWLRGGVPEKQVVERIRRTRPVYFDFSSQGLADLAQAGASPCVIDEMRACMRSPTMASRRNGKAREILTLGLIYAPYILSLFGRRGGC